MRNDAGLELPARVLPDGDVTAPLQAPLTSTSGLQVYSGEQKVSEVTQPRATSTAPATPSSPPAALTPRYRTVSAGYRTGSVRLPDIGASIPLLGHVVAPVGAPGKRPVVLFLHGRHEACYAGTRTDNSWPCKKGYKPLPSYRGYEYAQRALVS